MIRYGKRKRRGSTVHPTSGSQKYVSKSAERKVAKEDAMQQSISAMIEDPGRGRIGRR